MTPCCSECGRPLPDSLLELERPDQDGASAAAVPPSAVAALHAPTGPKARRTDPKSSHDAAKRAEPHRGTTSWRLMEALRNARKALSYAELSQVTGINPTTTSTRLTEIRRAGFIIALEGESPRRVTLTRAGHEFLNADRAAA